MISIAAIIRRLAVGIPTQWIKDVERLRERQPERSETLIRERMEDIKKKTQNKPVKRPGLFLRDLNRVTQYITQVKDPTKQGLILLLQELSNQISAAARKGEVTLTKKQQDEILESAGKLDDPGELLQHIADLFNEVYEGVRDRKASIAEVIRNLIFAIGENNHEHAATDENYR